MIVPQVADKEARFAFFMREADTSLALAETAPTASLQRAWLEQALSERKRALRAVE